MYTVAEIRGLRHQVEFYCLDVPDGFFRISLRNLKKIYNGAGSEAMSEFKRQILTEYLRPYECAFIVHDTEYTIGTPRKEADRRMLKNMLKIFRKIHGIFWFANKAAWLDLCFGIFPAYFAVRLFGDKAFEDANKEGLL